MCFIENLQCVNITCVGFYTVVYQKNCYMFTSHAKTTFIYANSSDKMFLSMHGYTFCLCTKDICWEKQIQKIYRQFIGGGGQNL